MTIERIRKRASELEEKFKKEGEVTFTVPGRPVPAARMTRRGKWVKRNAARYLAYKEQVSWCARAVIKKPFQGPVAVEIHAFIYGGRPGDSDNIAKSILDGCNGIAWEDDTQVVELHVYRRKEKPQRAEVKIWEVEEAG